MAIDKTKLCDGGTTFINGGSDFIGDGGSSGICSISSGLGDGGGGCVKREGWGGGRGIKDATEIGGGEDISAKRPILRREGHGGISPL